MAGAGDAGRRAAKARSVSDVIRVYHRDVRSDAGVLARRDSLGSEPQSDRGRAGLARHDRT